MVLMLPTPQHNVVTRPRPVINPRSAARMEAGLLIASCGVEEPSLLLFSRLPGAENTMTAIHPTLGQVCCL